MWYDNYDKCGYFENWDNYDELWQLSTVVKFRDSYGEFWQHWPYCLSRIESDILSVMFLLGEAVTNCFYSCYPDCRSQLRLSYTVVGWSYSMTMLIGFYSYFPSNLRWKAIFWSLRHLGSMTTLGWGNFWLSLINGN